MREMKDSGFSWLSDIPSNWTMKRVKHLFTRKNEKAQQENPTILSLARAGVRERDITNNEGQLAESYFNYNPVDIEDLLLNPMDLYSGANCSISKIKGVISPAYVNLRAKDSVNPVFYDYYFKVQYWMMAFFSYGKGVSFDNRWTLNTETLMNYPVVSMSYDEQCKRADYLDNKCTKIDAIIEREQTVIEKLKEYKLSVITEAVTKGLNPDVEMKDSGYEFIGEIPFGCTVTRVGHLYNIILGKMLSPNQKKDTDTLEKYFCAANVHFSGINSDGLKKMWFSEDEKNTYEVKKGDLLVVEGGAGAGGACIVEQDIMNCYVQNSIMIVREKNGVSNKWLFYTLYSIVNREYIDFVCNKATIPHFTKDKLSNAPIVLFPEKEIIEIVNKLDTLCFNVDSIILRKQTVINKLTEFKKSLIYEVVTGKKEV